MEVVQAIVCEVEGMAKGEIPKEEIIDDVKELGFQWLKTTKMECELIDRVKKDNHVEDKDWQFFLPMFRTAEGATMYEWNKVFPEDVTDGVQRYELGGDADEKVSEEKTEK